MRTTRRTGALLIALVTGGTSWLVIAISFDPFAVVGGGQPGWIWGPALGLGATATLTVLLIVLAVLTRGRARTASLMLWAVFLASATHRLVERSDGSVADRWLGIAVRTMAADPAAEPETPRCSVGRWIARCTDGTRGLVSPSILPMVPLLPGHWEA